MNYILFDSENRNNFLPLTFTRPEAAILFGSLSIREKWEKMLGAKTSTMTEAYLAEKFPMVVADENVLIKGSVCPNENLIAEISLLKYGEKLVCNDTVIAVKVDKKGVDSFLNDHYFVDNLKTINAKTNDLLKIENVWDIFLHLHIAIQQDFDLLTKGRKSEPIPSSATVIGDNIFIEKGARITAATINTATGAVYIGADAEIMEGALIRGPFSLAAHSTVKMGAKIYGATSIGKHCKVGGEITNCVVFDYSNKGHDGFIGNTILGSWCNLGADTNTSNLKNNYSEVAFWDYNKQRKMPTGQQFLGTVMGDYAKTGINTMLNTGTSIGVCANVFGGDFPPKFIPSFAWGGSQYLKTYQLEKAYEAADKMMQRRNLKLTETDKKILKTIFEESKKHRKE